MLFNKFLKKGALATTALVFIGFSASAQDINTTFPLFEASSTRLSELEKPSTLFLSDFKSITEDTESAWQKHINFTGAIGEGIISSSLGFSLTYGFGSSRKFRLGPGIRITSAFGVDRVFTAAPSDLASEDNPQEFVTETSQFNAINLGLYTDYSITDKLLVGFNIDVAGYSVGGEQEGTVIVDPLDLVEVPVNDTATPTTLNLLLVGNNDIGTLNSEFWIGYQVGKHMMIRGLFSYLFTEYTTEGQYEDDNDRFRYKAAQGALGLSYTF